MTSATPTQLAPHHITGSLSIAGIGESDPCLAISSCCGTRTMHQTLAIREAQGQSHLQDLAGIHPGHKNCPWNHFIDPSPGQGVRILSMRTIKEFQRRLMHQPQEPWDRSELHKAIHEGTCWNCLQTKVLDPGLLITLPTTGYQDVADPLA